MQRIVREGFVAGLIGAAAVALWFLIIDTINGHPFFTPTMLGSAVFWGTLDPGQVATDPERVFAAVIGYTMLHVVTFMIVGIVAATLAYGVERFPSTLFIVVVFFAMFEFGFYIVVAVLAQPLLGALAWWNVAIGNAIAALGMGYYLWTKHPELKEHLARHPLGEHADEDPEASVDTRKAP